MDAVPFQCSVVPDRDVVVVALAGELDLATAPKVAVVLADLVTVGFSKVVVDLTGLAFLDSTGLRTLMEASHRAAAHGSALSLVPGCDAVQRVFTLTCLDSHFTFELPRSARRKALQRWMAVDAPDPATTGRRHLKLLT